MDLIGAVAFAALSLFTFAAFYWFRTREDPSLRLSVNTIREETMALIDRHAWRLARAEYLLTETVSSYLKERASKDGSKMN